MRSLHIVKTSVGATWALRQMRELARLGIDVHVVCPGAGPLVADYLAAGVHVHGADVDLSVQRPWRLLAGNRALRAIVSRTSPDIIHSHFVGTTLVARTALGKRSEIPRLFQVPGPLHLEHVLFRRLDLITAGPTDHWIGTCRATCDLYRRAGVPEDRLHMSYYGVDVDRFERRAPGRLRDELGVPPSTPLVGMVAYMYAPKRYLGQRRGLKGHEDFIDAIAECRRVKPEVLGVVVGGAWGGATDYEAAVRRHAARRCPGGIEFLGTRTDVPQLYPDLDVAVHPSHSENVGGAVESLLLGVPTVTTNVGGFPDVIVPGVTGWMVPPKEPQALAAAILDALAEPARAREMAEKGRELVRDRFDVRNTAREVRAIYDKVLGASAG